MTLATAVSMIAGHDIPFRFEGYDGSVLGPQDAQLRIRVDSPDAVHYVATAPNSLGLARAYLMGALEVDGIHPADPYPLFALLGDLPLRRPTARQIRELVGSFGSAALQSAPLPVVEQQPRWKRVAEGLRHTKVRDAASIAHHYDVSNEFYRHVLGPSMTYTCACYPREGATLEEAQRFKYELIADKLGLQPGMRLLDVGCGWGGMVLTAARRGVHVTGVTLSASQAEWAQRAIVNEGLSHLATVRHQDYRDVTEKGFDAVSSIGLTEHIGVASYPAYFRFLLSRVRPGGRLLNHCITRRTSLGRTRAKGFIDRYVFPDGELTGVGRIITEAHNAGWEVRHEENLREHYALTLRDWCANLREHWDECVALAGEQTARVWGLYMAGSRAFFERNEGQLHQVLAERPDSHGAARFPIYQRGWGQG